MRKPDPPKTCKWCGKILQRKRYPSGRLEDLGVFKLRKYCDRNCMKSQFASVYVASRRLRRKG